MRCWGRGLLGLISVAIGTATFLGATAGFSADQDAYRQPVMLDTVIVTAQRENEPLRTGDVDKEISPVMVTTIERADFDGKTENIAEIIEKEAGVQVRQSGGLGSFSSVSLRGSSNDQVLIFLDGILLNDASGGGVDLSTVSLADVSAIDIYRGATPINFGSAGIGGAVNIHTLRSREGFQASATGGYGSFNSRKINGFINHKPGAGDYLISADYLAADNEFEIYNDNGTKWNPDDDRVEDRNNAQMEQANLLAKAGYDISGTLRLDLMNQLFVKDQGIPSWNNSSLARSSLDTLRNITTLQLRADDLTTAHLNTSTRLSYSWKEEEYDDRGGHIGMEAQHSTYTTKRFNADGFAEWTGARQNLISTIALFHERYDTEDHLGKSNPGESRRNQISLGVQDSVFFWDESLIVTPAARYTWIDDTLASDISTWGSTLAEQQRSDHYLTPQIGLIYGPLEWLKVKSNLAKYVRQPSFFELFGDRGLFLGNPDLREETGVNFDIGAECSWATPFSGLQRLSLNAAYFYTDADDLITRTYDARGIGKSTNISGALIRGVEAGMIAEFLDHFRAVINFTRQDPENESQIKAFDGKRLPGRYEDSFLGRLEARFAGVTVYGEYVQETGVYYDTANLLPAEDKSMIHAGISWSAGPWLIRLEGQNITDERVEDFNGYALPGRSFYLSVKHQFTACPPSQKRRES